MEVTPDPFLAGGFMTVLSDCASSPPLCPCRPTGALGACLEGRGLGSPGVSGRGLSCPGVCLRAWLQEDVGSLDPFRLLGGGLDFRGPPVGGEDGELRLSHPEVVLQGKQRAEAVR